MNKTKQMNRRGLSDVVTTVLIILFAIVAVAVVGGIVMNQINKAGKNIDKSSFCTSNTIAPLSCSQNGASVIVGYQQKTNDKELTSVDSVNINVESATGELVNTSIDSGSFPGGNGNSKSYTATRVVGVAKKISLTTTYTGKGGVKATCQTGPVTCGAKMPLDYVGYWSFDSRSGKDYSSKGLDGTLGATPPTFQTTISGDTYSSSVSTTDPTTVTANSLLDFSNPNSFTISVWVRSDTYQIGDFMWPSVVVKDTPNNRNYGIYFIDNRFFPAGDPNKGKRGITFAYGSVCNAVAAPRSPQQVWKNIGTYLLDTADGIWINYVIVYDATVSRFINYVNGVQNGNPTTLIGSLCPNAGNLKLGGKLGAASYTGGTSMDELTIYARALSAGEVAQIYNAQKSKFA
jgi:flagellin-like protein